jgi:D-proline reductase (dithiol) PrdB
MAELADLPLAIRIFAKAYPWRRIDPVPWTPLRKPLAQCRLALVTSAGFYQPSQPPFDPAILGGDFSYREIPSDTDSRQLVENHRSESFDHTGIEQDPNLAFPIDRVLELVKSGRLGSVNHRHLSFMGSIPAPGRLIKHSAPAAAELLAGDGVDVALLVPV